MDGSLFKGRHATLLGALRDDPKTTAKETMWTETEGKRF